MVIFSFVSRNGLGMFRNVVGSIIKNSWNCKLSGVIQNNISGWDSDHRNYTILYYFRWCIRRQIIVDRAYKVTKCQACKILHNRNLFATFRAPCSYRTYWILLRLVAIGSVPHRALNTTWTSVMAIATFFGKKKNISRQLQVVEGTGGGGHLVSRPTLHKN